MRDVGVGISPPRPLRAVSDIDRMIQEFLTSVTYLEYVTY